MQQNAQLQESTRQFKLQVELLNGIVANASSIEQKAYCQSLLLSMTGIETTRYGLLFSLGLSAILARQVELVTGRIMRIETRLAELKPSELEQKLRELDGIVGKHDVTYAQLHNMLNKVNKVREAQEQAFKSYVG